ncbi:MAG: enoyl-CoA hydratase/isomerase family protein, partial [Terriglobales bacterium]
MELSKEVIRVDPRESAVRREVMPAYTTIRVEVTPPHARITLAHPPQNVIGLVMMDELAAAVAEIEARGDVVTLTLAGSDKVFSVGVDVAAHTPDKVRDMLMKFHIVIRALVASRKVTIACVRGNCLGGGAELAMVCDLVYTSDDATWQFPEIK